MLLFACSIELRSLPVHTYRCPTAHALTHSTSRVHRVGKLRGARQKPARTTDIGILLHFSDLISFLTTFPISAPRYTFQALLCTIILSQTQQRTIRLSRVPGFIPFLCVYPYSYYSCLYSYRNPCTIYSSNSSAQSKFYPLPSFSLSCAPLQSVSKPVAFIFVVPARSSHAHPDAATLPTFSPHRPHFHPYFNFFSFPLTLPSTQPNSISLHMYCTSIPRPRYVVRII